MTRVGFVGLGRMGGPMCRHVLDAGHETVAYDVVDSNLDAAVAAGARPGRSPAEAARDAEVVCLVVRDDAQALEVLSASAGVLSAVGSEAIVVLHSTVGPSTVEVAREAVESVGARLVDAGISGAPAGAETGSLYVMCGGDAGAVDEARPVLDCYAAHVVRFGDVGAGMAAKIALNLAHYSLTVGIHEAMALAESAGVGLEEFAHVCRETTLFPAVDRWLDRPSARPFDPVSDAEAIERREHYRALAHKDLAAAVELAERLGADPLTARSARRRIAAALNLPT